ncbi:hypothetical protein GCM10011348_40540 [Marinobacterium nitratireducens]|uniref:Uncharacterized protein n=1 Tax=Marinobacterium nitratireducens TaxID=518897 RepID=A0A917ZPW9_9GAMM|nr:hypothetical protein GCM10011348_40540 [Marinobacterium nitratireducens]
MPVTAYVYAVRFVALRAPYVPFPLQHDETGASQISVKPEAKNRLGLAALATALDCRNAGIAGANAGRVTQHARYPFQAADCARAIYGLNLKQAPGHPTEACGIACFVGCGGAQRNPSP